MGGRGEVTPAAALPGDCKTVDTRLNVLVNDLLRCFLALKRVDVELSDAPAKPARDDSGGHRPTAAPQPGKK